jgi:signal peptidase II
MAWTRDRRWTIGLAYAIAALVVVLDQITKALVVAGLGSGQPPIVIIPGMLELIFRLNPGMAFSLLVDASVFLTVVAVVASVAMIVMNQRWRGPALLQRVALGLLLGGAIGNLIDRLRFGAVVDFVYVSLINFPAFNVADSCLTIGVLLMAWALARPVAEPDSGGAEERGSGGAEGREQP